ncbi:MAG: hypothetical protein V1674_06515 [Candidatus Omnitrophota bacterium]
MCYAFPAMGAIVTSCIWHKTKSVRIWWLNLLFWGGALFGIIDHLWNRELFLISENIVSDLMLGMAITVAIFASWAAVVVVGKKNPTLANYTRV